MPRKEEYSNSFRSLEAIWAVLLKYASKQAPMTVREIYNRLKELEAATGEPIPDFSTIERHFPAESGLMARLFPGVVAEAEEATAINAYTDGGQLHVVVETPEGQVLAQEGLAVDAAVPRFRTPKYSTLDRLLRVGIPMDLGTFPYQLVCVAKVPGKNQFVPYEELVERRAQHSGNPDRKNNLPRRYYLAHILTQEEWRIFADLVQVYPFISQEQTSKFLTVLDRLNPGGPSRLPGRYAFKRGSDRMFSVIAVLDQAIRNTRNQRRQKVRITYGEYRLELDSESGRWIPVLDQREKNGVLDFEPYALMWSNGNYYLVGKHRGMMNLRVDRILQAVLLEETFTPPDFDPVEYRDRTPVMYPGKTEYVLMRCRKNMLSVLVDFFGRLPEYSPQPDGSILAGLKVSLSGAKLFALQYTDSVEVLQPESLREQIAETLRGALEKYQ